MRLVKELLRHLTATLVLSLGFAATTGIGYFVLLLIAIVFNQGIGSPLALPFFVIAAGIAGLGTGILACFPVTGLSEILCRKMGRVGLLIQIPVALLLMLLPVTALTGYLAMRWEMSLWGGMGLVGFAMLASMCSLGVYWLVLRFVDGIAALFARLAGGPTVRPARNPTCLQGPPQAEQS